jgi:hypothetical protein
MNLPGGADETDPRTQAVDARHRECPGTAGYGAGLRREEQLFRMGTPADGPLSVSADAAIIEWPDTASADRGTAVRRDGQWVRCQQEATQAGFDAVAEMVGEAGAPAGALASTCTAAPVPGATAPDAAAVRVSCTRRMGPVEHTEHIDVLSYRVGRWEGVVRISWSAAKPPGLPADELTTRLLATLPARLQGAPR